MKHAFSLVELSIVLVILGLLTGGILAGRSLIRASELRAITTEIDRYNTATHAFRDKYFGLPGDIANATTIWGAAHATPATCDTTQGTGTQTCDGNGNSHIEWGDNEMVRYWQQLSNAGLLEGSFTGVGGSGGATHMVIGQNVPRSKMDGGGWTMYLSPDNGGNSTRFAMNYGDVLEFGGQTTGFTNRLILRPEELWNIDTKVDDGKPAYGKVIAYNWDFCTDATSLSNLSANYDLTTQNFVCALIYRTGF